ncbi:hypothetical protein ACVI1J_009922 [Bradyrhizobium diazoefficiens]|uniref:Mu-like prophage FluMu N-terminal domain-containing protein n=1 Tax=Bradyrhizobium huanghuaihaiense TaxID=990078 RepID=A0A562QRW8_9BRAD|nr:MULTISPECIES: hypothetical protein [Bradyrhizobium]WLB95711.1 hypothetical protein QIH92_39535 [Bradyrhizobium japonicum USDA 123]MBR0883729.1 hypothetical protein [Bradyrhizobium liaoningense]MBR1004227.1 hypothetical protein [Bradyrhizobium liaoningense]MCP1738588.1 hypothetical protein [Bradyrhizobium japonicum]MCW2320045.1 hypothetical protein [Bradyrhizobium japonicum]
MPLYRGLVTIKRDGRYIPPGTPLEMTENEAKALGPARVVLDQNRVSAVAEIALDSASTLAGLESAGDAPGDAPSADEVPPASHQTDGASTRVVDIASAIDLLDEKKDFFKSGHRQGKPKQKPIEEIVGFDITDEEIDAALALRASGV